MRTLEVWLHDKLVGHIVENRKGGRFAYSSEVAASMPGIPLLSLCLPVKNRPFQEGKTANWFEGLLPEGERRDAVCRRLELSPYDWMGLLAEIGWECAGAIRILKADDKRGGTAGYKPLEKDELADKLANLRTRQQMTTDDVYRMSLGGYQDKICVALPRIDSDMAFLDASVFLLPQGNSPSTHILKPAPQASPEIAESEAWAMTVASSAARCSKVTLLELDGAPTTLVAERYDRGGLDWPRDVFRIHQEDVCQALGLSPARKYASRVGKGDDPSYKQVADLLLRYSNAFEEEASELLRQLVVNLALGNWDAHAKNLSFLYPHEGVPVLAPMYDVVPVADAEPRTTDLSLRIDGSLDPDRISKERVLAEATTWGLDRDLARQVYESCLVGIDRGIAVAAKRYPEAAKRHESNTVKRLEKFA